MDPCHVGPPEVIFLALRVCHWPLVGQCPEVSALSELVEYIGYEEHAGDLVDTLAEWPQRHWRRWAGPGTTGWDLRTG